MLCAADKTGQRGRFVECVIRRHTENRSRVGERAAGRETQTFPVCPVGDLQGVDALGDLLVGGFLGDH